RGCGPCMSRSASSNWPIWPITAAWNSTLAWRAIGARPACCVDAAGLDAGSMSIAAQAVPACRAALWISHARTGIAVAMSAYHLWTGFFGTPVGEVHFPLHLLLALTVLFLARGSEGPQRPLALAWDG